jgi:hypothetical protein
MLGLAVAVPLLGQTNVTPIFSSPDTNTTTAAGSVNASAPILSTDSKTFTSSLFQGGSIDFHLDLDKDTGFSWLLKLNQSKDIKDASRSDISFTLDKSKFMRFRDALTKFQAWDTQATTTNMASGFNKDMDSFNDGAFDLITITFCRQKGQDALDITVFEDHGLADNTPISGCIVSFNADECNAIKKYIDDQLAIANDPASIKRFHNPADELK